MSSASAQNPTANQTVLGTHTYTLAVTNGTSASGCTPMYTTVVVTVNPKPTATVVNDGPVCVNGTVNLSASSSGGTGIHTFVWSGPGIASSSDSLATAIPAATGAPVYSITVSDTASGCSSGIAYTTTVSVSAAPTATLSNDGPICLGGTSTLAAHPANGVGAYIYTWGSGVTGSVSSSIATATPVDTGATIYSVTVSNSASGCNSTIADTTSVSVRPVPTATIQGTDSICVGGEVTLTASAVDGVGGYVYLWMGGGIAGTNTTAAITATPTITTVYSVTVSNSAPGCNIGSTDTARVVVNPVPTATITGTSSVCQGGIIDMVVHASGGVGAYIYAWSGGTVVGSDTTATDNPALPGTITYSVVVSDTASGCNLSTPGTHPVIVNPLPTVNATATTTSNCVGAELYLNSTPGGGSGIGSYSSYLWSGPHGFSASMQSDTIPNITLADSGVYSVFVTDSNGCTSASAGVTASVTVNSLPIVPPITIAPAGNICLNARYQNFGIDNVNAQETYNWSATNAVIDSQWEPTHQYCLVSFIDAVGSSTITLTVDSAGCPNQKYDTITVRSAGSNDNIQVYYYNDYLVCVGAVDSVGYQWGCDSANLHADTFKNETHQSYFAGPNKPENAPYYWVMTTEAGGCYQKTYYNQPFPRNANPGNMAAESGMQLYPNPAQSSITVELPDTTGAMLEIFDMLGQKVTAISATQTVTGVDVARLAPGHYLLVWRSNGIKMATAQFIKD